MRRFVCACAAGGALYLAMCSLGWAAAAPLGIALLLRSVRGAKIMPAAGAGLAAGVVYFGLLLWWAKVATGSWLAYAVIVLVMALFYALLAIIWRAITVRCDTWWEPLPLAAAWCGMEELRSEFPFGGMPWGNIAYGQVEGPFIRLAPWGGVLLVTFAVVVVGALVETLTRGSVLGRAARLVAASAMVAGCAILPLGGAVSQRVAVGFVQGNVDEGAMGDPYQYSIDITTNLAAETEGLAGADLVLWPEAAANVHPDDDSYVRSLVELTVRRLNVPLVLGATRQIGDGRLNTYAVWTPGAGNVGEYAKQHPVPFGEYVPLREQVTSVTSAFSGITKDMVAGTEPAIVAVPTAQGTLRIATPICFEVAFGRIVNEAVRGGAAAIVVPTNNAPFGTSGESQQQFAMTRFRAVEAQRTAIQVSTVGVSGVVDPSGIVSHETSMWTAAREVATIGLRSELTPAVAYAEHIHVAAYVLGALAVAAPIARRTR